MPVLHEDIADPEIHNPKGFAAATNETALIKNSSGHLEYRDLSTLGAAGPTGPAGPSMATWVTATNYIVDDVLYSKAADSTLNKIYRCIVAHTSGASLLGDLANWEELSPETEDIDNTARISLSTGLLTGCVLSINGLDNTKYDMTAGTGIVVDNTTTPGTPIITQVSIDAISGADPTDILTETITFICFDSAGNLVETNTESSPSNRRDLIVIGAVSHVDHTTIDATFLNPNLPNDASAQAQDLMQALGFFSTSGNQITGNTGTLTINKGAGAGFDRGRNYENDPKDPHNFSMPLLTTATMLQILQDASVVSTSAFLNPTQYDNAGVLTSVPANNNATIGYIYIFPGNELVYLFGQEVFSTLADAISAAGTESVVVPSDLATGGLLLARVIMRKTASDITDPSDAKIIASTAVSTGGGTVSTLQQAYDASTEPEIVVTPTRGAFTIRDNSTPLGEALSEVQDNAGTIDYWRVAVDECKTETQAYSALNTLTDDVDIDTDCADGNVHEVTLTDNRTLGAPTNLKAGATYLWIITQDGTGSRTLAYNAVFKFPGGTAPTLTTTAGAVDILSGVSDGTNVYCNLLGDFN